jgi:carboxymethylenebutenolidase
VRRAGTEGFLALGPDALTSLGGYPGDEDEGRTMQRSLDGSKIVEDFIAAAKYLKEHPACSGSVGVVGFCFGGGMANTLAVRIPEVIKAAVPFYGRQPDSEDVPKIKASLLIQYGELDKRINEGWPDYEAALKKAGINYTMHMYPGVNHGFHNDTTPRYDEAAATLAWKRTIDFFNETLR